MKIYIVGPPGSGKTTLAKKLSKKYNINNYELDKVKFNDKENHRKRTDGEIKKIFHDIINKNSWIIEDISRNKFNEGLKLCDTIYYLKISKEKVYRQVIKRWVRQKLKIESYNYPPTLLTLFDMIKVTHGYYKKEKQKLEKINQYSEKVIYLDNKKLVKLIEK